MAAVNATERKNLNQKLNQGTSQKPNQLLNAVGLYLGGVLTLAILAYGCKALLGFL